MQAESVLTGVLEECRLWVAVLLSQSARVAGVCSWCRVRVRVQVAGDHLLKAVFDLRGR